jgi:hypothetical protein
VGKELGVEKGFGVKDKVIGGGIIEFKNFG